MEDGDILCVSSWKNSLAFKAITSKETQFKYYVKNDASKEVLELVKLDSKAFGSHSEKIICEIFNLGSRTSTQNDATLFGKKIEIKTARYWGAKDDCVWQHLEPEYDYDYVLLVLLDFCGWKVWCVSKKYLMEDLRNKNIVKFQGKQGFWTRKTDILPYLQRVKTIQDLKKIII